MKAMTEIRECEICGKKSDFWTEIVAQTVEGEDTHRKWRTIICSECIEDTTIEQAGMQAREHLSSYY